MALKLQGVSDTIIQKQGRWTSMTFLQYIHNQIAYLTKDLSTKMHTKLTFCNIANIEKPQKSTVVRTSPLRPFYNSQIAYCIFCCRYNTITNKTCRTSIAQAWAGPQHWERWAKHGQGKHHQLMEQTSKRSKLVRVKNYLTLHFTAYPV